MAEQLAYGRLPSSGDDPPAYEHLLDGETYDWDAVANLDLFFTRIYRYWEEKGFVVSVLSRVLNVLAVGFTVAMTAVLLLGVDYSGFGAQCVRDDTCDLASAIFRLRPFASGVSPWQFVALVCVFVFTAYWAAMVAHLIWELRSLVEVRHFVQDKLGASERAIATMPWPGLLARLVAVQGTTRLCAVRDLDERDVIARVMRRENYLIAMLNKGVLALNMPCAADILSALLPEGPAASDGTAAAAAAAAAAPGAAGLTAAARHAVARAADPLRRLVARLPSRRRRMVMTKTLEWNLHWCVLDPMFDENFLIRKDFLEDAGLLTRRFKVMAVINVVASPFLLVFLLTYFFMKNAEQFYHHPSSVGARRWSPLARWRLREFNELPFSLTARLNASHEAAELYIRQFPSHRLSHVARFVSFVAGSFAALLLLATLFDARLLERDLFGRHLVWWLALLGVLLAASRAFIIESTSAFDPERALSEVVRSTHYLPRHWRGHAHTREVQEQFGNLFAFKAVLFLEELASVLLTPFILWFALPTCSEEIVRFVRESTERAPGVGDTCSYAAFDFTRHGDARYGAPNASAPRPSRSRQGKLEKSFVSFVATYPSWRPPPRGLELLRSIHQGGGPPGAASRARAPFASTGVARDGVHQGGHARGPYAAVARWGSGRFGSTTGGDWAGADGPWEGRDGWGSGWRGAGPVGPYDDLPGDGRRDDGHACSDDEGGGPPAGGRVGGSVFPIDAPVRRAAPPRDSASRPSRRRTQTSDPANSEEGPNPPGTAPTSDVAAEPWGRLSSRLHGSADSAEERVAAGQEALSEFYWAAAAASARAGSRSGSSGRPRRGGSPRTPASSASGDEASDSADEDPGTSGSDLRALGPGTDPAAPWSSSELGDPLSGAAPGAARESETSAEARAEAGAAGRWDAPLGGEASRPGRGASLADGAPEGGDRGPAPSPTAPKPRLAARSPPPDEWLTGPLEPADPRPAASSPHRARRGRALAGGGGGGSQRSAELAPMRGARAPGEKAWGPERGADAA